jgi:hypothetical protein
MTRGVGLSGVRPVRPCDHPIAGVERGNARILSGDKSESTVSTERSLHSVRGTATMKIACAPGATAARGAFSAMAVRRRAPASSVLRLLAVPRPTPAAGMNQPLQA